VSAVVSLDRIEAFVFTDNQRSLAVLERRGYTKDEPLPAHVEDVHGVLRDE
jgi:RimJ/RimL family protein N-acetyltransferase